MKNLAIITAASGCAICQSVSGVVINVPGDMPTIQIGINNAAAGDTVLVAPGTWNENIDFNGQFVVVMSSGGPGLTTINGDSTTSVVTMDSGEPAGTRLEGFTITGGVGTNLGFPGPVGGGALVFLGADVEIVDCVFDSNTAERGGGIGVSSADADITDCVFIENEATEFGGGVYFDNGHIEVVGCTFTGNSETGGGHAGAIQAAGPATTFLISQCTFTDNESSGFGGAISSGFSVGEISECEFRGNSADDGGGAMIVGGPGSDVDVLNCLFFDNSTNGDGGAGQFQDGDARIAGCLFHANTAATGTGGAIHASSLDIELYNCTFTRNEVELGPLFGGAVFFFGATSPTADNCIFWDNSPNEIQSISGADPKVRYSIYQGGWTGTGSNNTDADPMFVDPIGPDLTPDTGDEDFSLGICSPGIDAADSGVLGALITEDLAGNPRLVDAVNYPDSGIPLSGPYMDIGAYEADAGISDVCAGDADGNCAVDVNDITFIIPLLGDVGAPCLPGDVDGNGVVDVNDITFLTPLLGTCGPGPCS